MSGKQAAINAATAQMLRAMLQGKRPGGDGEGYDGQNETARREAQAAQKALADELKALGEKFGDADGEGMRERVQRLEEEARNLTRMLDQPREEVTERQDRFLARMLQSALSLHREEEGKDDRKSTSAGIIFTKSEGAPPDSLRGGDDSFYTVRRRALIGGSYPPGYRQSINTYFDSLGVLYLK
jgi:molecular chaperone GrpE (heat shock protein)